MFKYTRAAIFIIGILLIAVTLCGFLFFTDRSQQNIQFWVSLAGILLSESGLIFVTADLGGNHRDRGYLYRVLNPLAAICYIIFSWVMLIPMSAGISIKGLCFIEVIGLFIFLCSLFLINMGAATVVNNSIQNGRKKAWFADLHPMNDSIKLLCYNNVDREFRTLLDAIRYAPESVESEKIDSEIETLITDLKNAVINRDGQNSLRIISEIKLKLQQRAEFIKLKRLI